MNGKDFTLDVVRELSAELVNPKVSALVQGLADTLTEKYEGFYLLCLFGSQATGKASSESDVDLIGAVDWGRFDTHKAMRIIEQAFSRSGLSKCRRFTGSDIFLNMAPGLKERHVQELQYYALKLSKVSKIGDPIPKYMDELFRFCAPFGVVYGDRTRIERAQTYIEGLISATENPVLVRDQLRRVLRFMYR